MAEYKFVKRTRHTFMAGDVLDEKYILPSWKGRMEPLTPVVDKPVVEKIELDPEVEKKLEEITADLKDDGKLNHSNNDKKKSPGRPKKRIWTRK